MSKMATFERDALKALLAEKVSSGQMALPGVPDGMELSYAQQRLWFVEQVEGAQVTYNFPSAVKITGPFDPDTYRESLQRVVRRHPILTATFDCVDGVPHQRFHPDLKVELPIIDLSDLAGPEQESRLQTLLDEEARTTFSLSEGPLFHCGAIKLGYERHVLLMNLHHIITDGWSSALFNQEVSECYGALMINQEPRLAPLAMDYSDYVYWQQAMLQGAAKESLISRWKAKLSGMQTLQLPLDRPRSGKVTRRGAHHQVTLRPDEVDTLQELATAEGASLYMVLLAVYKATLYTYYKQTDIVLGTSAANRKVPEMEQLQGLFVNQLVIRTSLADNPTFTELVGRVKQTTTEAFALQDLPFDMLASAMDVTRKPGESVLFQSLFLFNNFPRAEADPNRPVQMEVLDLDIDSSRFDLVLTVEKSDVLNIKFTYRTDLFDPATIITLCDRYLTTIKAVVKADVNNADILLSQIDGEINMQQTPSDDKPQTSRFKRGHRAVVNLSQHELVTITDGYPTVITPANDNVELAEWISLKREVLEKKVLETGTILFRGFGIDSPEKFERMANAYCPDLFGNYGDLPKEVKGKQVYKSTPYPEDKVIMFHNESSHTQKWPMKQMFASIIAAETGGETPIVDCRKVYNSLSQVTVRKFAKKKLAYVRNFIEGLDVSWQEFFKTDDKAEVETICAKEGMKCEWVSKNHLRTTQIANAVCLHPKTGEKLFFNQIQLHHVAYMSEIERDSLLTLFKKEDLPRNVYYGDGSDIEPEVIVEIDKAYEANCLRETWQQGDFMIVDNMITAHGRTVFTGPRKVVVAMGDLIEQSAVQTGEH